MTFGPRRARWWTLSLIAGTYFAAVMVVFGLAQHRSLHDALVVGVTSGLLFGAVMGPVSAQRRGAARAGLTEDELVAADAVEGGPPPVDPHLRELAHRLAVQRLSETSARSTFSIVLYAATGLACAVAGVYLSRWYLLLAAISWGVAVEVWLQRHRLVRRVRQLGQLSAASAQGAVGSGLPAGSPLRPDRTS